MSWMHKIRLRVLAFCLGVVLATFGVMSLAAVPAWAAIGMALATVAVAVNSMTSRLGKPTCYGCGKTLEGTAHGDYGAVCPECGSINPVWDDEDQPQLG